MRSRTTPLLEELLELVFDDWLSAWAAVAVIVATAIATRVRRIVVSIRCPPGWQTDDILNMNETSGWRFLPILLPRPSGHSSE